MKKSLIVVFVSFFLDLFSIQAIFGAELRLEDAKLATSGTGVATLEYKKEGVEDTLVGIGTMPGAQPTTFNVMRPCLEINVSQAAAPYQTQVYWDYNKLGIQIRPGKKYYFSAEVMVTKKTNMRASLVRNASLGGDWTEYASCEAIALASKRSWKVVLEPDGNDRAMVVVDLGYTAQTYKIIRAEIWEIENYYDLPGSLISLATNNGAIAQGDYYGYGDYVVKISSTSGEFWDVQMGWYDNCFYNEANKYVLSGVVTTLDSNGQMVVHLYRDGRSDGIWTEYLRQVIDLSLGDNNIFVNLKYNQPEKPIVVLSFGLFPAGRIIIRNNMSLTSTGDSPIGSLSGKSPGSSKPRRPRR